MKKTKDFFYNFQDLILVALLLVLICYVLYNNLTYLVNLEKPSTAVAAEKSSSTKSKEVNVIIPKNVDKSQLAKVLKGYGIIDKEEEFINKFDEINKNARIKSGNYKLNLGMNAEDILEEITE